MCFSNTLCPRPGHHHLLHRRPRRQSLRYRFTMTRAASSAISPRTISRSKRTAARKTIRYFSQESGLPLTLGLLIDTSLSQRRFWARSAPPAIASLSQVLRPDQDRAFVIHFDREVELLQDLTSSREKLDDALAQLGNSRRSPPPTWPGHRPMGARGNRTIRLRAPRVR